MPTHSGSLNNRRRKQKIRKVMAREAKLAKKQSKAQGRTPAASISR